MPINFPSPPSMSAPNSGDLFQLEGDTPSQPSILEHIAVPATNSLYDHLWSPPSEHLTHASPQNSAQSPIPPKTHAPQASHSALERAIQTLQGNYRELQHASRSELSQTRIAVERRMDDLAEAMHNDMRRLREETLSETTANHSDVFRCATTISHIQDRLSRLEIAFNSLQDTLRSLHPAFATALSDSPTQPQQQPLNHSPVTHPTPIALAL